MPIETNQPAYCIEYFYAKSKYKDKLKNALLKLAEQTKAEPGCLQYDLLQDNENESLFILLVKFTDRKAITAHENQLYIKSFMTNEMTQYCEKVIWNDACLV